MMRTKIKQHELRKAREILRSIDRMGGLLCRHSHPAYLAEGSFNIVFALTADLVVRVCRDVGVCGESIKGDSSWEALALGAAMPELGMVKLYHKEILTVSGTGYLFGIIERCETVVGEACSIAKYNALRLDPYLIKSAAIARFEARGLNVWDLHTWNMMLTRGRNKRVVITDCHVERKQGVANVEHQ